MPEIKIYVSPEEVEAIRQQLALMGIAILGEVPIVRDQQEKLLTFLASYKAKVDQAEAAAKSPETSAPFQVFFKRVMDVLWNPDVQESMGYVDVNSSEVQSTLIDKIFAIFRSSLAIDPPLDVAADEIKDIHWTARNADISPYHALALMEFYGLIDGQKKKADQIAEIIDLQPGSVLSVLNNKIYDIAHKLRPQLEQFAVKPLATYEVRQGLKKDISHRVHDPRILIHYLQIIAEGIK